MKDAVSKVTAFSNKFGIPVRVGPRWCPDLELATAVRLINEEFDEFEEGLQKRDLVATVDAVIDLIYVLIGLLLRFGVNVAACFDEVHATNMLKSGGGVRADGKILKPADWQPPRIELVWDSTPTETQTPVINIIDQECDSLKDLLIRKNKDYGNSFSEPLGIFCEPNPDLALSVRIEDKLKRLKNIRTLGSVEIQEDTEQDLIGYLILRRVLRRLAK